MHVALQPLNKLFSVCVSDGSFLAMITQRCTVIIVISYERHAISNLRQLDCSFNGLFKLTTKTLKLRISGPF